MNRKEFLELDQAEQDALAAKHGITRSGLDNQIVLDEELAKIPEAVKDEKAKKEDDKPTVEEAPKRSKRKRATK